VETVVYQTDSKADNAAATSGLSADIYYACCHSSHGTDRGQAAHLTSTAVPSTHSEFLTPIRISPDWIHYYSDHHLAQHRH